MKAKLLLVLSFTVIIFILVINLNSTDAYSSSPPVSYAGAPMDNGGNTCAVSGCHTGSAITQTTGVITHDIPGTGFIGGTSYNFSVTMSGSSAYGFELTPQSPTSNAGLGTWIAGVGTAVSTKYIRQSAKGTGASKTWTFKWTAPATATAVTFYGAFNYANNNGSTSGDIIKTSSVSVLANTTGINDNRLSPAFISVFPNPTTDLLYVASVESYDRGSVYTLDGKLIKSVSEQELISKTISVAQLENGIYFIHLSSNSKNSVVKFCKN
jgi:hypothetical protein